VCKGVDATATGYCPMDPATGLYLSLKVFLQVPGMLALLTPCALASCTAHSPEQSPVYSLLMHA
jgi:hypothetical protein